MAAFSYDDRVVCERHVDGRELSVAMLAGEPLPVVEARPRDEDRYSYEAATRSAAPSSTARRNSAATRRAVVDAARGTWEALRCEGFCRVDLMLGADGPEVLEVNSIPGLTDTSLFPMAAEAAGIGYEDLCARHPRAGAGARRLDCDRLSG